MSQNVVIVKATEYRYCAVQRSLNIANMPSRGDNVASSQQIPKIGMIKGTFEPTQKINLPQVSPRKPIIPQTNRMCAASSAAKEAREKVN